MTDSEREVLFRALVGRVEGVRDPAVVKQLEEIAAGQLAEIESAIDSLLWARLLKGMHLGIDGAATMNLEAITAELRQATLQTGVIPIVRPEPLGTPISDDELLGWLDK